MSTIDWKKFAAAVLERSKTEAPDYTDLLANVVGAAFAERDVRDEQSAWQAFATAALSQVVMLDDGSTDATATAKEAAAIADAMMIERAARRAPTPKGSAS